MVMIPRHHETELTGRARARPGWFGKQVLQVEARTLSYPAVPPPPGRPAAEWRESQRKEADISLHWCDATWEDLMALERLTLVPRVGVEPSQPWPRGVNVNQRPNYQRPPAPPSPPPAPRKRKA